MSSEAATIKLRLSWNSLIVLNKFYLKAKSFENLVVVTGIIEIDSAVFLAFFLVIGVEDSILYLILDLIKLCSH